VAIIGVVIAVVALSGSDGRSTNLTGGSLTGGLATGPTAPTGGAPTGATAIGPTAPTGGAPTGGTAIGPTAPTGGAPTGATGGLPTAGARRVLRSHIPSEHVTDCDPYGLGRPPDAGELAAFDCDFGTQDLFYFLFDSREDVTSWYETQLSSHGIARNTGDCPSDLPAESTFTNPDSPNSNTQRLMCYVDGDTTWIEWARPDLHIYVYASGMDGIASLYRLWRSAGPE
jgi:hypothetical protein